MNYIANAVSVYAVSMTGKSLEREIDIALMWMSGGEREKYRRFRFDRHRREFALSRFVMRGVLGALTGSGPEDVDIRRDGAEKPYLGGDAPPSFNLTHTDDFVALIAGPAGLPLGVDAEPVDRDFDAQLLAEVFTDDERRRIADDRDGDAQPVSFWTAKEAYLKQIGAGLSIQPKRLALARGGAPGARVFVDGRPDAGSHFHFATIGRHRLCAATPAPKPPQLYLYDGAAWRLEKRLWSP